MKNRIIRIISVFTVAVIVTCLCACTRKKQDDSKLITNRSVTLSTLSSQSTLTEEASVEAVAPVGEENIIEYLNGSLTKFHNFDYDFNKNVTTVLKSFSAGDLDEVSGATETYRSTLKTACADMMGVGSLDTSYYVGDDKTEAFPLEAVNTEDVRSAAAYAEDGKVIVDVVFLQQDDGTAAVQKFTKDYMTNTSFNEKIKGYEASATDTAVKIGSVSLRAVIDYSTRVFDSVVFSFSTDFYAENVSLAYVKGGPIKGSTETTVTYNNFDEKR